MVGEVFHLINCGKELIGIVENRGDVVTEGGGGTVWGFQKHGGK